MIDGGHSKHTVKPMFTAACVCVCVAVSRLRLLPGFLPPEEADWIFGKLLAELPWSQKTNYRQGVCD